MTRYRPVPVPWWNRALAWPCILVIKVYQVTLSPVMGRQCRFSPTCSWYGLEAYRTHGGVRGTWLTLRRLARCHPLGGHGYDPVPPRDVEEDGQSTRNRV